MQFLFLSQLETKALRASISFSQDHHCHNENRMGPSYKYLSALFPAPMPMLADLYSRQ
jgi:hypothetical protein